MGLFRVHVFVCVQEKPEGAPSCADKGGKKIFARLKKEVSDAGLEEQVLVTGCGCLGLCGRGPNLVFYPEGVWYSGVKAEDVPEIVKSHIKDGKPVERLRVDGEPGLRDEILEHARKVARLKQIMESAGMLPPEAQGILRGFWESRAFLTAIELDLFSAVGEAATAEQVAQKTNTHPRAVEMLLNALAAMGLLEKKDGLFKNTELGKRFLVEGAPFDSRTAAMHTAHLWHRWSTLTECVKKGTSVVLERGEVRDQEQTKAFIAAMHRNASFRADQLAALLGLEKVRRLLDLGGGSGAYSIAFARKNPEMEVVLFDLPQVIPLAREYIAREGMESRIKFLEGDMMKDPIGEGYDLVLLSAICHMWSPEENLALFRKIRQSLNPEGRLVIQDFILEEDKTRPRFAALFALNMLVNTKGGSTYSAKEYMEWLSAAGFSQASLLPLPGPTDLVIGTR